MPLPKNMPRGQQSGATKRFSRDERQESVDESAASGEKWPARSILSSSAENRSRIEPEVVRRHPPNIRSHSTDVTILKKPEKSITEQRRHTDCISDPRTIATRWLPQINDAKFHREASPLARVGCETTKSTATRWITFAKSPSPNPATRINPDSKDSTMEHDRQNEGPRKDADIPKWQPPRKFSPAKTEKGRLQRQDELDVGRDRSSSCVDTNERVKDRSSSYVNTNERVKDRSLSYVDTNERIKDRSLSYVDTNERVKDRSLSYVDANERVKDRSSSFVVSHERMKDRSSSFAEANERANKLSERMRDLYDFKTENEWPKRAGTSRDNTWISKSSSEEERPNYQPVRRNSQDLEFNDRIDIFKSKTEEEEEEDRRRPKRSTHKASEVFPDEQDERLRKFNEKLRFSEDLRAARVRGRERGRTYSDDYDEKVRRDSRSTRPELVTFKRDRPEAPAIRRLVDKENKRNSDVSMRPRDSTVSYVEIDFAKRDSRTSDASYVSVNMSKRGSVESKSQRILDVPPRRAFSQGEERPATPVPPIEFNDERYVPKKLSEPSSTRYKVYLT